MRPANIAIRPGESDSRSDLGGGRRRDWAGETPDHQQPQNQRSEEEPQQSGRAGNANGHTTQRPPGEGAEKLARGIDPQRRTLAAVGAGV